jgi:predicted small metal-binding protein
MPSIKKSVMLNEGTLNYIKARVRDESDIGWSEVLNEGFRALKWLSNQALPDLTPEEWQYILNAYSACMMSFNPPYRIASDLMYSAGAVSIEELTPEYADLVKKIHAMSELEQYAIQDFAIKFLAGGDKWNGCKDFAEVIEKIKRL